MTREGDMQSNDARLGMFLKFVGVEEVVLGMAAAEEQQRRTERLAFRPECCPLPQETAERREPRPRPNHDDRRGGIDRQSEADLGFLDERLHRAASGLTRQ